MTDSRIMFYFNQAFLAYGLKEKIVSIFISEHVFDVKLFRMADLLFLEL